MKAAAAVFLTLFVLLVALFIRTAPDHVTTIGGLVLGGAIGLSGYIGIALALTVLEGRA